MSRRQQHRRRGARPRVQEGPRAVDGIDLRVEPGEIYGFLGPNGAGKSTTVLHAHDAAAADRRARRASQATTSSRGAEGARGDRRRAPGGGARPAAHRARPPAPADDAAGIPRRSAGPRADELLERVGLTEAADRKVGGYSGGMKRRLDLALALVHRPAHPVPRRADDRPRPAEPHGALGRGRAARARGRRHGVPDDAVPRGGRRPRRPRRDHRPRADRRRGHAGRAEGRDRTAERRRDPRAGSRTRRGSRSPRPLRRAARRDGDAGRPARRRGSGSPTSSGGSTPRASSSTTSSSAPRRLDDVFLAKTGRTLEGAEDEDGR